MEAAFWYVYMLRSQADPDRHYVGLANDLDGRLRLPTAPDSAPHS